MKIILFGQIGLRKKICIQELEDYTRRQGKVLKSFHVGKMMYESVPTIKPHRILQKDIAELSIIRQRVWDKIIEAIHNEHSCNHFIINSHSTFRWSNGLSIGFTKDEIIHLSPDICITLIDNIQDVKYSLQLRPVKPEPFTLKDIIVWREEEIMAAELAASLVPSCKHYIVAKDQCPQLLYKIIFENHLRKAYLSYPITNVRDNQAVWSDIENYRQRLMDTFICFDPISISEGSLKGEYLKVSLSRKRKVVEVTIDPENVKLRLPISEVKEVIPNIDGQIISRDFKLIDQSDMVIAYIPELAPGQPAISTGVERELAHAQNATMETFVIWPSTRVASPFQQATKTFRKLDEFLNYIL